MEFACSVHTRQIAVVVMRPPSRRPAWVGVSVAMAGLLARGLSRRLAFPGSLPVACEAPHRLQLRGQHRSWRSTPHRFPYSPESLRAPSDSKVFQLGSSQQCPFCCAALTTPVTDRLTMPMPLEQLRVLVPATAGEKGMRAARQGQIAAAPATVTGQVAHRATGRIRGSGRPGDRRGEVSPRDPQAGRPASATYEPGRGAPVSDRRPHDARRRSVPFPARRRKDRSG